MCVFCDIIFDMKKNVLFLLLAVAAVAGCQSNDVPVDNTNAIDSIECVDCGDVNIVQYSMPNGNDLKLETAHHVIQIDGRPGKQYDYYVWTGEKTYADDPDIIVQDGTAAVLVEEQLWKPKQMLCACWMRIKFNTIISNIQ